MMNSLSRETRIIYKTLQLELYEAYYRIKILDDFFVQNSPDILNKVSPHFFGKLFIIYLDSAISIIGKFLDPAKTRGQKNVSLIRLIDKLKQENDSNLIESLRIKHDEIKNKSKRIILWRHKICAHTDEEIVLLHVSGLRVNIKEIKEVMTLIKDFLNLFEDEYQENKKEYNLNANTVEESIAKLHQAVNEINLTIYERTVPYTNYLIKDGVELKAALQKSFDE